MFSYTSVERPISYTTEVTKTARESSTKAKDKDKDKEREGVGSFTTIVVVVSDVTSGIVEY